MKNDPGWQPLANPDSIDLMKTFSPKSFVDDSCEQRNGCQLHTVSAYTFVIHKSTLCFVNGDL